MLLSLKPAQMCWASEAITNGIEATIWTWDFKTCG